MNTKNNNVRNAVVISVTLTVLVVASLIGMFIAGVNYQKGNEAIVQSAVKAAVQAK